MTAYPSSSASPRERMSYVRRMAMQIKAEIPELAMNGVRPAQPEDYLSNKKLKRERWYELYGRFRAMVKFWNMSNKSLMARTLGVNRKTIDRWIVRYKNDQWHESGLDNDLLWLARQAEAELPVELIPPPIEPSIKITA